MKKPKEYSGLKKENFPEKRAEQGITVRALSWQPDTERPPVLDTVSLRLEPGHIYGILGPNGSGKTSLLKHILSLLPSQKAVLLNGEPLERQKAGELAKKLSYVPQDTLVEADYTVGELVLMGRSPWLKRFEAPGKKDRELAEEAMRLTNCLQLKDRSVLKLSGGERQRAAAARAVAQGTEWLFLDEPVSSLDLKHQLELMEILARLCGERGTTVVVILHDVNLALRYCDRLILMKEGRLFRFGSVSETASAKTLSEVYGLDFEEIFAADGSRYMIPRTTVLQKRGN
ncbi:MAG: ABC transporter ATP-binding protein [Lachnospiraceae bacterium]|nr:ABC transporter ATP-binding protein [Lachnospiraceae bacterium]